MPSRRGFLAFLGGAAALALDPERALWVPGAKLISIPAWSGAAFVPDEPGGCLMTLSREGRFDPRTGLYHWRIDAVIMPITILG